MREAAMRDFRITPQGRRELRSVVAFWNLILDTCLLKMGPISCTETSVRNYHYSLRNNLEARSSQEAARFSLWYGSQPTAVPHRIAKSLFDLVQP